MDCYREFSGEYKFSNVASTGSIDGIYDLSSATLINISNNIVRNLSTPTTGTINGININTVAGTHTCSNNQVYNFTTTGGGAGGATFTGIGFSVGNATIFGNQVYDLNSTGTTGGAGGTITGIRQSGGTTNAIYNNKIYNLSSTSTGAIVYGINSSGGTTNTIYNNIIGDLRATAANLANAIRGIDIASTNANVYYNTINLNATSSGAVFGTSAINVSSTTNLDLRNNILTNTSTANTTGFTTAYRRSTAVLTAYLSTSNNNLFYAGAPSASNLIFYDGTNSDQTLVAFKARVTPRDAVSVTENPSFVSTTGSNATFLHIDTSVATQIESGGATIAGITSDFDGDVRNVSTPDIGADEFAGLILDLTAPSIVHTATASSCSPGSRVISATITDASGVPTLGIGLPVAYWNINAGAYSSATGVSIGAGVYEFTIGTGSVLGDVVAYYFVTQDNASTPNVTVLPLAGASGFTVNPPAVSTLPTTPFSYTNITPLNGVYSVGVAGVYPTITAAVADYNLKCLTGSVTFELLDATYPSEIFPITIQQNLDANSVNTLTIKPAAGVTAIISGSNASAIIKLNGADYVTIDGSNNGSTSKNLTLENTNASGVVTWVASANASNGSLNNVIKNNNFIGGSSTTTVGGVLLSGTVLGNAAESQNNNIIIDNNTFTKMQNAIFAIGNATTPDFGWNFTNNNIGSIVAISKLGFRGIAVQNAQSFVVSGNQITGITTTSTSTTSAILIGGNAFNGSIYNNTISDIKNTNATGYGANGIYLNSSNTTANILTYNNFIFNIAGNGYASGAAVSDNGYGIICTAGAGYSIYNNTVVLNANQTVAGLPAAFNATTGITIPGAINLRNNIFINSQTQAGEKYTIYSGAANTVYSSIDYNNYFSSGTNLGFIGSARTNLAAIQAGFGQNVASLNVLPVFVSTTDLHLVTTTNTAIDNKGTAVAGVTLDIDGNVRNVATPDMGADEFTSTACTSANGGTITALVNTFCDSGNTTISSIGYSTGFSTTYQWQSSVDLAFTTPVNEGASLSTYADLVTPSITATTYYRLAVTCVENGQANFSNVVTITITPSSSLPTEVVSVCDTYTWAANGTTYTTGGMFTSTTNCVTRTLDLTIVTATAPTGASTQTLNGGVAADVTIEDIVVTGSGIVWYSTLLDANAGTNPIAAGTVLTDNTTYYAVSINGTCRSSALAVTVTVVLGNQSFDSNQLSYYPNPVTQMFNVTYNKNITSVQIFDLSGRMVKAIQPNTVMVEINLSDLSSAMYIVKLQSEDNKQTEIKIVKK